MQHIKWIFFLFFIPRTDRTKTAFKSGSFLSNYISFSCVLLTLLVLNIQFIHCAVLPVFTVSTRLHIQVFDAQTTICFAQHYMTAVSPESIQPFWISREPVAWPWCNLATSQRRPYCPSVNSHSPVGLVSRQWDAFDWACVLCDRRIHKSPQFQRWY